MSAPTEQLEILWSVIVAAFISMMDDHASGNRATESLFHDNDMLKDVAVGGTPGMIRPTDLDVAICRPVTATLPMAV